MTNYKKFLSYYRPYKKLFLAVLISAAFVAILSLILPILVRHITGTLLVTGSDHMMAEILRIGGMMLGIITLQTGFAIFYAYKGHDAGAQIERDMRQELFAHYQKLSFSFFDQHQVGELMTRLTNDLNGISEMLHHTPENIVIHGTQFFGSLAVLFVINWRLALVVSVLLLVMIAYTFPFYRKTQRVIQANRRIMGEVNALAQENLSGHRLVKSYAAEGLETAKFQKQNHRHYLGNQKIYKYEALNYEPTQFFFRPLITIAIVVAGGWWIYTGHMAPADLLIFIMYAAYLTQPIPQLAFMVGQVQEGLVSYRRFREIMDITPAIQDAPDAVALENPQGHIQFHQVSFQYTGRQEQVLQNIHLDIPPGEMVAIVGQSGIGKTTLCGLISRFYDVTSGAITIDGIDIRRLTQSSLRQHIGVVSQDTFLFAGTVLENILYGNPNATEQEAIAAAQKANAHDFITRLPQGYHTPIGQRGITLSGGQQQRLSIARVFLKNPPILIFDEATSALDTDTEAAVMESLLTLAQGRTTLIIAHRLSTITHAHRVITLDTHPNSTL